MVHQTPSQTVGPYFAYGLVPSQYGYDFTSLATNEMVNDINQDYVLKITGKIYDGEGKVIPDAMIELWQYDGQEWVMGRHGTGTFNDHRFEFYTVKPISVLQQAPCIHIILFMRGQLRHTYTVMYFEDEIALNKNDQVLQSIPESRRQTVLARKHKLGYVFDIYMQGENETTFFSI